MRNRFSFSLPLLLAGATLALLGGCSREEEKASPLVPGTLISVAEASKRDVPVVLVSVGRVESRAAPQIAAEVEGRIVRLAVDAGDVVASGAIVAELDPTSRRLELQAASAEKGRIDALLANAARRAERFRDLQKKGSIAREQLDNAEAELAVLQAQRDTTVARLHIAEDQLAKTQVRSPLAGSIQMRLVSAGDFVKRGEPLFEITTSQRLRALLPFPEMLAKQLTAGVPVTLRSPLAPEQRASGVISELRPAVGDFSRAVWAIVDIDNPGDWRPAGSVRAEIVVATHRNAVVVPAQSLVRRPAGEVVYVVSAGRAKQHLVRTGERQDGLIEILDGVAAGATVAVEGAAYLSDGAVVRVAGKAP